MKVIHLRKPRMLEGVCYCGAKMNIWHKTDNWDATKTTCKGAMRVIKAAWAKQDNHEKRLKIARKK